MLAIQLHKRHKPTKGNPRLVVIAAALSSFALIVGGTMLALT